MIYYNEIDKKKALWLKELMNVGVIAEGEVDTRSIEDVSPAELLGYSQCHFFAGIGVWSYALRLAGWPDGRPVWTGSCPCQPFSQAGKRDGFDDERHLWPAWRWLIRHCRPVTVFGEQVASKDGLAWIDLVQADLESEGYSFGAPHIRQRLFLLGHNHKNGQQGAGRCTEEEGEEYEKRSDAQRFGSNGDSAATDTNNDGLQRRLSGWKNPERQIQHGQVGCRGTAGIVNGFWGDCDWIRHKDGKYRPVEPGSFPLVDGTPSRVLRVCGYGDAIVVQVAQGFIESAMEVIDNLTKR